ncbi:MAG: RimK family alpha-L-glutamate ligase [Cellulosilyticaceae bacterium]
MYKGWLIYNEEDYKKNEVYAKMLMDYGKENELDIELILREDLILGVDGVELVIDKQGERMKSPHFAINRSRDSQLAKQLEYMKCKVFNSSQVTEIANDKGITHQFINRLGITSVPTLFYNKTYMDLARCIKAYPVVIKSVGGHGGEEVYKVNNIEEAQSAIDKIKSEKLLIQKLCNRVGVDVRVFVIGNEIIGAIKRSSEEDFRSNYSLGGKASPYALNQEEMKRVYRILEHLACDFVGIDFMIDAEGNFVFNEIEDAVGSRTLYQYTEVDSASLYIQHIKKEYLKCI